MLLFLAAGGPSDSRLSTAFISFLCTFLCYYEITIIHYLLIVAQPEWCCGVAVVVK